jgi:hypothetical protein
MFRAGDPKEVGLYCLNIEILSNKIEIFKKCIDEALLLHGRFISSLLR